MNEEYRHKKNILVLGASGFVGAELVKLLARDSSVKLHLLQHHQKLNVEGANIIDGNLNTINRKIIDDIKPDIIFHLGRINARTLGAFGRNLAAIKGKISNEKLIKNLQKINRPVKLIYLSGSLMYGKGYHDENTSLSPVSFARQYYLAKPFLQNLSDNISVIMARAPWIIGNGSWFKSLYLDYINQHQKIPMYSDDDFKMNFINVAECAAMLEYLSTTNFKGIINLSPTFPVSYKDFIISLQSFYPNLLTFDLRNNKFSKAFKEAVSIEVTMRTNFPHMFNQQNFLAKNGIDSVMNLLSSLPENK